MLLRVNFARSRSTKWSRRTCNLLRSRSRWQLRTLVHNLFLHGAVINTQVTINFHTVSVLFSISLIRKQFTKRSFKNIVRSCNCTRGEQQSREYVKNTCRERALCVRKLTAGELSKFSSFCFRDTRYVKYVRDGTLATDIVSDVRYGGKHWAVYNI